MKRLIAITGLIGIAGLALAFPLTQFFREEAAATRPAAGGGTWPKYGTPWVSPAMSSATAPSPYAVIESGHEGGFSGWYAMDQSYTTIWSPSPTPNDWPQTLTFDCGETNSKNVVQLSLWSSFGYGHYWINAFDFDASQDNTNYTTLFSSNCVDSAHIRNVFTNFNSALYRYYRLKINSSFGIYAYLYNMELSTAFDLRMTSATTPSPQVVTCSSEKSVWARYAWEAFDNSTLDGWYAANSTMPQWIKIDLGAAKVVDRYIMWGAEDAGYGPNSASLDGSIDDSTWTILDSNNFVNTTGPQAMRTFANTTPYRYYRFTVYSYFASDYGPEIRDLRLYVFE